MVLMNDAISLNLEGDKISFQRAREIIKAVLDKGNPIELKAAGYSMFPTFRPGDRIIIKPIINEELVKHGSVVVCEDNGVFVMHRIVKMVNNDAGIQTFITRGDSTPEPDKPWVLQQLIGIAVSLKRNKKELPVKTFMPGSWRYLFNRRLLWIFNKCKRLKIVFEELVNNKS
jgi:signal peptidase I